MHLLKEWRWTNKMTQDDLSKKLDCSQSLLAQVENGKLHSKIIQAKFMELFGKEEFKKIYEFKIN